MRAYNHSMGVSLFVWISCLLLLLNLLHLHGVTCVWHQVNLQPQLDPTASSDASENSYSMACNYDQVTYTAEFFLSNDIVALSAWADGREQSHWTLKKSDEAIVLPNGWSLKKSHLSHENGWNLFKSNELAFYHFEMGNSAVLEVVCATHFCHGPSVIVTRQDSWRSAMHLATSSIFSHTIQFIDCPLPFNVILSIACLHSMGTFWVKRRNSLSAVHNDIRGSFSSTAHSDYIQGLESLVEMTSQLPYRSNTRLHALASGLLRKSSRSSHEWESGDNSLHPHGSGQNALLQSDSSFKGGLQSTGVRRETSGSGSFAQVSMSPGSRHHEGDELRKYFSMPKRTSSFKASPSTQSLPYRSHHVSDETQTTSKTSGLSGSNPSIPDHGSSDPSGRPLSDGLRAGYLGHRPLVSTRSEPVIYDPTLSLTLSPMMMGSTRKMGSEDDIQDLQPSSADLARASSLEPPLTTSPFKRVMMWRGELPPASDASSDAQSMDGSLGRRSVEEFGTPRTSFRLQGEGQGSPSKGLAGGVSPPPPSSHRRRMTYYPGDHHILPDPGQELEESPIGLPVEADHLPKIPEEARYLNPQSALDSAPLQLVVGLDGTGHLPEGSKKIPPSPSASSYESERVQHSSPSAASIFRKWVNSCYGAGGSSAGS